MARIGIQAAALAAIFAAGTAMADPDMGPNDVSFLMPPPQTMADMARVIRIDDLAHDSNPVWPREAFEQIIGLANGPAGKVLGTDERIDLSDFTNPALWHVASFRIEPVFPGMGPAFEAAYGRTTQIQMVAEPLTIEGGRPRVHDVAMHLIYKYVAKPIKVDGCPGPIQTPDTAAYAPIVRAAADLKQAFRSGALGAPVDPGTLPLGVHPGIDPATRSPEDQARALEAYKQFLEIALDPSRLAAAAVAYSKGNGAPWLFLPTGHHPDKWVAVPSPALVQPPLATGVNHTELLALGDKALVAPAPAPRNLDPISCIHNTAHEAPPAKNGLGGVSTALLFAKGPGANADVEAVVDVIADTAKSHLFDTDCISCHTETRIEIDFSDNPAATLHQIAEEENIDADVLPKFPENVRNFGWFAFQPGSDKDLTAYATVTRRTARETADAVTYINANFPD